MFKNKLGEDSTVPKFIHLKIRRRSSVKSLTTLEEGEFKVPIDGCINITNFQLMLQMHLHFICSFVNRFIPRMSIRLLCIVFIEVDFEITKNSRNIIISLTRASKSTGARARRSQEKNHERQKKIKKKK